VTFGLCATFGIAPGASAPAIGQTMDTIGQHAAYCGTWHDGVWAPSGNCNDETTVTTTTTTRNDMTPNQARSRVGGTITSVRGHMVTLEQSTQSIVINDQAALDHRATGRVAVGRQIMAHGVWRDGTFFANRME